VRKEYTELVSQIRARKARHVQLRLYDGDFYLRYQFSEFSVFSGLHKKIFQRMLPNTFVSFVSSPQHRALNLAIAQIHYIILFTFLK
jgi:hypothetical protein